jgi:uncharacterized protein YjiS (DUF1127 family)
MNLLQNLVARYQEWATVRQAEMELQSFSDRELTDLGISRSDISALVRQKPASTDRSAHGAAALNANRATA